MYLPEVFNSFAVLFVLLGTLLLFVHSLGPIQVKNPFGSKNLGERIGFSGYLFRFFKYPLFSITQMPVPMLAFLVGYGLILSFYFWHQKITSGLAGLVGLSILTTVCSLVCVSLMMSPVLYLTQKYFFDYVLESRIFRIAIYAVLVPVLYIFIIHDHIPGSLVRGIMLSGLILSFYQIFRGIILCLRTPSSAFNYLDSRFLPILMIISWLLIILFNLFTMVLLVSGTDPYSFVDSMGPVTEPLRLLYFTVITFTSVGYGDITPRGSFAVFITILVSVTGFLYSALFIGGILAVFTNRGRKL
ncbi:potassium channel family protein [Desulforamulus ferrireducens]|uniref:Ion transporter n=1 Tax=Desulforamulus ferrireducens TaxID=1833852 RepID=A0A1S6IV44_9FIRM|nr:potassium channel family protein [Desulforamulus ferrireducens]AQS58613.1 ion transporter [Desulforamulus ferrireducens]